MYKHLCIISIKLLTFRFDFDCSTVAIPTSEAATVQILVQITTRMDTLQIIPRIGL